MQYLVTTVYAERDYMEGPSFFLLPVDEKIIGTFHFLEEKVQALKNQDSGIVTIERWLPRPAIWVEYDESLEEVAQNRDIVELTDEEVEELGPKSVDVQTIHVRPEQGSSPPEAYVEARHGNIRVESRSFTSRDLRGSPATSEGE
jgi:hypothetical protein